MSKTFRFVLATSLILPITVLLAAQFLAVPSLTAQPLTDPSVTTPSGESADLAEMWDFSRRSFLISLSEEVSGQLSDEELESLSDTDWLELLEYAQQQAPVTAAQKQVGVLVPRVRNDTFCLASPNLCDAAARIVQEPPCLAATANDCPAYESWKQVMGQPGIRRAPESVSRAGYSPRVEIEPPTED